MIDRLDELAASIDSSGFVLQAHVDVKPLFDPLGIVTRSLRSSLIVPPR